MKTLKLIVIAVIATAFAAPAFAGGDAAQLAAQKRAYERLHAPTAASHKVTLGCKLKHPSERVRA